MGYAAGHSSQRLQLFRPDRTLLLLTMFRNVFGKKQNAIWIVGAATDSPRCPAQPFGRAIGTADHALDLEAIPFPIHQLPEDSQTEIAILHGNNVREAWMLNRLQPAPEHHAQSRVHCQDGSLAIALGNSHGCVFKKKP